MQMSEISFFFCLWQCPASLSLFSVQEIFVDLVEQIVSYVMRVRVVTKISSCLVNIYSRWGIKHLGISLTLFFFYFTMKVARGHIHSSLRKSLAPALNDHLCVFGIIFYSAWTSENLDLTSHHAALCLCLIDNISNLLLHHFLLVTRHYIYSCKLRNTVFILQKYTQLYTPWKLGCFG